jgi:pyrroline-5-carboxylate reductase
VFIALHPPVIIETLNLVKKIIRQETIFISLAPKITISNIAGSLANKNIVRFMPNATSIINKGYNPVCFNNGFRDKQATLDLLSLLGKAVETEESKLEAYAVISGMLPTYFWFQWYDLIETAEQIGLSGLESKEAIQQTLHAAIDVMFKTGLSEEEVLDLIPVKPLEDNEVQISKMLKNKLIGFFTKIKPVYEPMLKTIGEDWMRRARLKINNQSCGGIMEHCKGVNLVVIGSALENPVSQFPGNLIE